MGTSKEVWLEKGQKFNCKCGATVLELARDVTGNERMTGDQFVGKAGMKIEDMVKCEGCGLHHRVFNISIKENWE